MSTVSKTHNFLPATDIESAEVNQNFDDLVNYTNAEVIVRDASKAFTATPSGPGSDPTSPNQLARKQYVDDKAATVAGTVTALTTTVNGHTTSLTQRPTINSNSANIKIVSLSVSAGTNVNGDGTVSFPAGSFTTCTNVVAVSGDMSAGAPGTSISTISLTGFTNTGFTFRAFKTTSAAPFGTYVLEPSISAACRINYFAIGS
jgi:hypothetical protein